MATSAAAGATASNYWTRAPTVAASSAVCYRTHTAFSSSSSIFIIDVGLEEEMQVRCMCARVCLLCTEDDVVSLLTQRTA